MRMYSHKNLISDRIKLTMLVALEDGYLEALPLTPIHPVPEHHKDLIALLSKWEWHENLSKLKKEISN